MTSKPLTTEAIALTEKKMDMALDDIIKLSKKTTTKENKAPRRPIKSQGFLNGIASQRSNKVQHFMDSRSSIRQGVLAQRRSNFHGNQFPLTANATKRAAAMPIRNMAAMPFRNMANNWKKPRHALAIAPRRAADSGVAGKVKCLGAFKALTTSPRPAYEACFSHSLLAQDMTITKQRPQTMDALFANMKEKRMMIFSLQRQAFQDDSRQNELMRHRARQQQMRGGSGRNGGGVRGGRWFGNSIK